VSRGRLRFLLPGLAGAAAFLCGCHGRGPVNLTPAQQLLIADIAADQVAAEVLRGQDDGDDLESAMAPFNLLAEELDAAIEDYRRTGQLGSGQPLLDAAAIAQRAYESHLARASLGPREREIRARRAEQHPQHRPGAVASAHTHAAGTGVRGPGGAARLIVPPRRGASHKRSWGP